MRDRVREKGGSEERRRERERKERGERGLLTVLLIKKKGRGAVVLFVLYYT